MEQQNEQLCEPSAACRQLRQIVEAWYVWLSSTPRVLFQPEDQQRMMEPIIQLAELVRWQSESAHAKHAWLMQDGITVLRRRLNEGDYDCYET